MKFKNLFLTVLLTAVSIPGFSMSIQVTPGKLASILGNSIIRDADLKLIGSADGRDLLSLSYLPNTVTKLDLSELRITGALYPTPDLYGRKSYDESRLPEYVFLNSELETIILPSLISVIPEGAFAGAAVKEVLLPFNCVSIEPYAFYGTYNLKNIYIPETVKKLGERAFAECKNLETLNLPEGIELSGAEIFFNSGLKSIDAQGVMNYADYSLSGIPALQDIKLNPAAVYGEGVLSNNLNLVSVSGAPDGIPDLFATGDKSLKTNNIISNARIIGDYAFASLLSNYLVFPSDLTFIGDGAFAKLTGLEYIDVNLLKDRIPEVTDITFDGIETENVTLFVAAGTRNLWEGHPVWSKFNITEGESGVNTELSSQKIKITSSGKTINIFSEPSVGNYIIYNASGRILHSGNTSNSDVSVRLDTNPSEIVIVKVENPQSSKTTSIILP